MIDYLGNELHIDDMVVFVPTGYRFVNDKLTSIGLMKGKIVSMTNKKSTIEHNSTIR